MINVLTTNCHRRGESTNLKSGNKIIGHRSAATERSKIILQLVTGLLELLNEKTEDDSNGGTGSRGAHTSKTFGLNCGMGGTVSRDRVTNSMRN